MVWHVYVTRKRWCLDEVGLKIHPGEWIKAARRDESLSLDETSDELDAEWLGNPDEEPVYFSWWNYCIRSQRPSAAAIRKMWAVARALGATVQDEDGRELDEDGLIVRLKK